MPISQPTSSCATGILVAHRAVALFAASKVVVYDTLDPDCFWHLRVADQLHRDGIGPLVDDLSYESNRQPWTPYSWLAELGMKKLWDVGGFRAAVAFTAAVEAGILVLLALCCLQLQATPRYLSTILCVAIGAFLILPFLSFRPVTFAFLLLFIIAFLLLRDLSRGQSPWLWVVVPLTALLTNIHLFSFFVPGMALAFAIGALIERKSKDVVRYAALATLASLACLATPMLPGFIRTLFYYRRSGQNGDRPRHR